MRPFTKVTPDMWASRLRNLTDAERVLLLYYWSGMHQAIAGVSRVPDAYAADDLAWAVEKCSETRAGLLEKKAISWDESTHEVLVEGWWPDNWPNNPSHMKAANKGLRAIKSPALRAAATEAFARESDRRAAEIEAAAQPTPDRASRGYNLVDTLVNTIEQRKPNR